MVLVMMGILTSALVYAFVGGLDMQRRQAQRQSEQNPAARVEKRITRLLEGALLSEDTADTTTFFVAATEQGDGTLGADRLTFTTGSLGLSLAVQQSTDDFETQHEQFGPQGGITEISLGIALLLLIVGGSLFSIRALTENTASSPPAAPRAWPVMDLVELMASL